MKKFNWDEFKNTENKIAVHCKTEEEAKDFRRKMHEKGMKWCDGENLLENTVWYIHGEKTCYVYGVSFAPYGWTTERGYRILEWSDYMQKEFTKADLKDGMVVKYRDGNKRMVINEVLIGENGYADQYYFREDLTHREFENLDIVGVYKTEEYGCFESMLSDDNLTTIWERKEPKKMTIEEMRKKLEELTGEQIEVTA